jgi:hypothetical protein
MRRPLISVVLALLVTMLTAYYQRTSSELVPYEGVEPGWSYTHVTVGGWPLAFIYDKPYFSPTNRVDWFGVLLGMDQFRPWPFLGDVAIYFALSWVGRSVWLRGHRAR